MKFIIHSAINNIRENGNVVSKIRGELPELGCAGELTLWDDKVAKAFCTTFNPDGSVLAEGVASKNCFAKRMYPVIVLDDEQFKTATEANKDYKTQTGEIKQDRVMGLEVFRIYPKTDTANWLAAIQKPVAMPAITSGDTKPEDLDKLFG
jgi:hypothetical protein